MNNNELGNLLASLAQNNGTRKPIDQWNAQDFAQFLGGSGGSAASQIGGRDSTSNLGKYLGRSMGMQTSNGLGGSLMSGLGSGGYAGAAGSLAAGSVGAGAAGAAGLGGGAVSGAAGAAGGAGLLSSL